jgi:3-oxoacyl-[acyl-carrier protein] reductase
MDLKDKKILVVGASSDIGIDLNRELYRCGAMAGFHYHKNASALSGYKENNNIKKFQKDLITAKSCFELIDDFVNWAKGIDYLVQLSGNIRRPIHWEGLIEEDWNFDLNMNLIMPFFLAQKAITYMKRKGGRIILMSTASASYGGGSTSFAYGVAKSGIDCIVKKLAKDCAQYDILVNAIAPGFILTKFHTEKMKRTEEQIEERIKLIPLKRAGTTKEFAAAVMFLLAEGASYITGQIINVSGGDRL